MKVLDSRLLVQVDETASTQKIGGIEIPADRDVQKAKVIAVGPGGIVDGNEVKMQVSVGQKVIIRDYAGTTVKIEDEEYIIVRQDDIVAIVED